MHAYDHGVAMHIIKAIVKTVQKLEIDLGLPNNTLMHKLTARLHNLSSSLDSKHTTLLGITHQLIVSVFETLTTRQEAVPHCRRWGCAEAHAGPPVCPGWIGRRVHRAAQSKAWSSQPRC